MGEAYCISAFQRLKNPSMQRQARPFAQVLIPSPLKEPLTYAVPPSMHERLEIGMRVQVPLGKRKVTGVIVDFIAETTLGKIREILAPLDEQPILDRSLLQLAHWASRYYLAPFGEVLSAVLPPTLRAEARRVVLPQPGEFVLSAKLAKEILAEIRGKKGRMTVKSLARKFPGRSVYRALDRLAALGAVKIVEQPARQQSRTHGEPLLDGPSKSADWSKPTPTREQKEAIEFVRERLNGGGFETILLYGVTGSGKTEVYLRAVEETRNLGKRSLILVPEISLTPQLLDRLEARFPGRVGVLHSGLTRSDHWSQWWRIAAGFADVVVGARSAIFAPVLDVGLIVVDEEHDPSYKQDEGLRYHARDLAIVRAKLAGCVALLGSATPSIESFENCRQGRYRLLELTKRVEERSLPRVEMVDLRSDRDSQLEIRSAKPIRLFSYRLSEALKENYGRGRQSLLFLNRRGFANFLQCYLCGFVFRCSHCSVTLTYHLKRPQLFCHHCGFRQLVRDTCPACGNSSLKGIGVGTQQIEEELSRLIPQARVGRMDRDSIQGKGSPERLFRKWEKGEIDIMVGTQMITKGHDIAKVTLVGVLLADQSLNIPDFRAAERTFQLLTQVAGRAGRGEEPGEVIVQTYAPEHYTFQYVASHDYRGFFAAELDSRRALAYPPFARLAHLKIEGPKAAEIENRARQLGELLREEQKANPGRWGKIEILGPAPAPIQKLRGRYRWQILLKGKKGGSLLELAARAADLFPDSRHSRLHIDVDPYNML
ncbi:MAG: primosomal protein N' [Deltaproteobacteria bacterium]|nr:primosomal protein N' [Deltaproteobacteria bacterium]